MLSFIIWRLWLVGWIVVWGGAGSMVHALESTPVGLPPGWNWYNEQREKDREAPPVDVSEFLLGLSPDQLKHVPLDGLNLDELNLQALKVLLTAKREKALDQPTVVGVTDYLEVHRAAFRRAGKFTTMWELALYTQPELDYHSQSPPSAVGHSVYAQTKRVAEDQVLQTMREQAGLFFFFSSTCSFCQKQSKILKLFQDEYGWRVFPVTVDGGGLEEYPNPKIDNGMGEQMGIQLYPTIVLSVPGEKFLVKIAGGLVTVEDLRRRIVRVLQDRQLIPAEVQLSGL